MLGGKLVERFFRQVVRFVDTVEAVFGCGQNHAAAHADVHHEQIVVAHHHIHGFERVAGKVEGAFWAVGTGGFEAAVVVVVYLEPEGVVDFLRPGIAVAVEAAFGEGVGQLAQGLDFFGLGFAVPQDLRGVEAGQALLRLALGELVELVGAEIAAAPFGQGKGELEPALFHQKRQIAPHQLLLQRHGGAGYHQPLATRLCHDAAG